MTPVQLRETVAYCGLVCGLCPAGTSIGKASDWGPDDGCKGCRAGGGDAGCAIRECAQGRGYAGCWQCAEFPCERAGFGSADWHGLVTACVLSARDRGLAAMADRLAERGGRPCDFGAYRGMPMEQVLALWWGEA
jgi:hypothetical protein